MNQSALPNGIRAATSPSIHSRLAEWAAVLADYWTLTKPEVNFLILIRIRGAPVR